MTDPALSIIMPVYNAQKHIRSAVESLLKQSFHNFELIVINDGCTDKSMEMVRSFGDNRIRILNNDKNRGIVFSRNRGIAAARGRYLAPFDADDVARQDKFEKQIAFMEANKEYGMIGSWAHLIDDNDRLLKTKWKLSASPERISAILLFRNYFVQSAVVIRREAIPEKGYVKGTDTVEDYHMWAQVASIHKVWNYPDYLVRYRIHEQGITSRESSKMPKRDSKVFRFLYEPLQIQLDDRQLALLQLIKGQQAITDMKTLKDVEAFLLELLKQNKRLGLYHQKHLCKEVQNRWLKTCFNARGLKHKLLLILLRSPLLHLPSSNWQQKCIVSNTTH